MDKLFLSFFTFYTLPSKKSKKRYGSNHQGSPGEPTQTLATLSGGEGQRLKLAKELINHPGKNNLYLMDEPTTGLHPVDVDNFLTLFHRMVDSGGMVIVVEHNL